MAKSRRALKYKGFYLPPEQKVVRSSRVRRAKRESPVEPYNTRVYGAFRFLALQNYLIVNVQLCKIKSKHIKLFDGIFDGNFLMMAN